MSTTPPEPPAASRSSAGRAEELAALERPIAFFAPRAWYASIREHGAQLLEFKEMVRPSTGRVWR